MSENAEVHIPDAKAREALISKHGSLQELLNSLEKDDGASKLDSASSWDTRHLIAFRLTTTRPCQFFKAAHDHANDCPVCYKFNKNVKKERSSSIAKTLSRSPSSKQSQKQQLNKEWVKVLAKEATPTLVNNSDVWKLKGASFWSRLMQFVHNPEDPGESRSDLPREAKKNINYAESIASGSIRPPSTHSGGSDSFKLQIKGARECAEILTESLIHEFLNYAVMVCLEQEKSSNKGYRVRQWHQKYNATFAGNAFSATDDGGIDRICMVKDKDGEFDAPIALVECKRVLFSSEEGKLIVPETVLAQIFGEAIAMSQAHDNQKTVYVIVAANVYMRIFRFKFGQEYAAFLEAKTAKDQAAVIDKHGEEATSVVVESSYSMSLAKVSGRQEALCGVYSIVRDFM